jgi:hypothetical protein
MHTSAAARQFVTWAPLVAVLVVLLPALAGAQEPVKSFDQLNTRLKVGDTVWVTDAQGRETKAQIRELGPSALTLKGDSVGTLQSDAVRLVKQRKGKPVLRFTLYGVGIGAAAGAAISQVGCSDCGEALAGGLVWGSLIGAGAGAAIGAMRSGKEVVVYRAPGAPGSAGSARLSVTPMIARRTKGVAVSFAF